MKFKTSVISRKVTRWRSARLKPWRSPSKRAISELLTEAEDATLVHYLAAGACLPRSCSRKDVEFRIPEFNPFTHPSMPPRPGEPRRDETRISPAASAPVFEKEKG